MSRSEEQAAMKFLNSVHMPGSFIRNHRLRKEYMRLRNRGSGGSGSDSGASGHVTPQIERAPRRRRPQSTDTLSSGRLRGRPFVVEDYVS